MIKPYHNHTNTQSILSIFLSYRCYKNWPMIKIYPHDLCKNQPQEIDFTKGPTMEDYSLFMQGQRNQLVPSRWWLQQHLTGRSLKAPFGTTQIFGRKAGAAGGLSSHAGNEAEMGDLALEKIVAWWVLSRKRRFSLYSYIATKVGDWNGGMPGNWPVNSGQSDDLYNYIQYIYICIFIVGYRGHKSLRQPQMVNHPHRLEII